MADLEKLWTVDDLVARYGVTPEKIIDLANFHGLPHIALGALAAQRNRRGPKHLRFRPEAVLGWEAEQERQLKGGTPEQTPPPRRTRRKTVASYGWDGIER